MSAASLFIVIVCCGTFHGVALWGIQIATVIASLNLPLIKMFKSVVVYVIVYK